MARRNFVEVPYQYGDGRFGTAIGQTRNGIEELVQLVGLMEYDPVSGLWAPPGVHPNPARFRVDAQLSGSKVPQAYRLLTSTPLAASGSYIQPAQIAADVVVGHVQGVAYTGAIIYADTRGSLFFEERHGNTWLQVATWPVGGGERQVIPLQPVTTGVYRWTYYNGSTPQTQFELYEFVSQLDGRVRPLHIRVLQNVVVPAGASQNMGRTSVVGYNSASVYIQADRPYQLEVASQTLIPAYDWIKVETDQQPTGVNARHHRLPDSIFPAIALNARITNLDSSNDMIINMWLVANP